MEALAGIRRRYGLELPHLYQRLLAQGHLGLPWRNYLALYDCEWLSLEAIADYQFLDFQITSDGGFVPFAASSRQDEWCWRLDWAGGGEPPVVFCEQGEEGFGYAADFRGFLYRKLLEEFGGYNDLDGGGGNKFADLQRAVAIVAPLLPDSWAGRLRTLSQLPLQDWSKGKFGELRALSRDELQAVIAAELAFPHLDERFPLDKEQANRNRP